MFSGHCSGLIHSFLVFFSIFSSIFIQHFISPEINELSSCHVNLIMTHFSNLFLTAQLLSLQRVTLVLLQCQEEFISFSWKYKLDPCGGLAGGQPGIFAAKDSKGVPLEADPLDTLFYV